MRNFVINLLRRPDRKEWFTENNPYLKNMKFVKAFDGKASSYRHIHALGYDVDKSWRDPKHDTRITDGEVGCFISHYNMWKLCVKLNETIYISEDDIKTSEKDYNIALEYSKKYDFVYIGQNDVNPDTSREIDDQVYIPGFPYNLSSYFISPRAAQYLIDSDIAQNIIPADEYVPVALKKGATQWGLKWCGVKDPDVKGFVTSSDVSLSGLNNDRVDAKFFRYFNTHVVTVATDESKATKLFDSAEKNGISITNIGKGVEWKGTDMSGPGGGQKINLMKSHLETLPDEDLVLFVDGYDTFFSAPVETIVDRYLEDGAEVVFAAEKDCWPDDSLAEKFDLAEPYPFLNSGCYIGTVKVLKEMLQDGIKDNEDDQLYIQNHYDTVNYNVVLDHGQYIFMTMDQDNLVIYKGDTFNEKTRTFGCIVHGNGGNAEKRYFDRLYNQMFGAVQRINYLPAYGKHERIGEDTLVVDFMSKAQCEQMIELSEAHGGWEPLPGDKFPAYEIRIKELGLWDELEAHWVNEIYPIVEKYWHPLKMYGLRDAFTMRYSMDTQTSLNLHHDASLVTGSVKLNDNYKGATLIFPRQYTNNEDVPVGKCILFPGQVTHGHYCDELKEGTKYSLTMWTSRYKGDVN